MARTTGLRPLSELAAGVIREASAVIAADSATLTDANIPVLTGINCKGLESIFVGVEITGGASPTMTLEPLFRDAEATDGSRWKRFLLGALPGVTLAAAAVQTSGALSPATDMAELRVFGHELVFLRISAVANSVGTTAWKIIAFPGRRMVRA